MMCTVKDYFSSTGSIYFLQLERLAISYSAHIVAGSAQNGEVASTNVSEDSPLMFFYLINHYQLCTVYSSTLQCILHQLSVTGSVFAKAS